MGLLLKMEHVRKSFGDLEVLKDISFCRKGRGGIDHRTFRFREIYVASLCDEA